MSATPDPTKIRDDRSHLHERARERGVNPFVYWIVRALFQPFFHVYFRLSRLGREHIPDSGPVIFAANHRSFLDPFVIATLARRPLYYVAKAELFHNPIQSWFLNALGAFPVDRGNGDGDMIETAKTILGRGDCVLIFPEGTRIRPGALASPKRGVGRLALETGAPVVPVAVIGTEAIRRGWRIRPHKVRIRAGRPLTFPRVEQPSRELAAAVTERIWPCVMLQWEWLGGVAPIRRATVIGAGRWGTTLAGLLERANVTTEVAERGRPVELAGQDLVVLAVPPDELPAVIAEHGDRIPRRAGVLVASKGLVPPLGMLPSAYVSECVDARAVACVTGPAEPSTVLDGGAALIAASADRGFARQIADLLRTAGLDVTTSSDVTGVELAGAATHAATVAAATASAGGPNAAGAAAGKVFAEVAGYARARGARPETLAGLAGTGDLLAATLSAPHGASEEATAVVPLLAELLAADDVPAPTLDGLAAHLAGAPGADDWAAEVVAPPRPRRAPARAA